MNHTSPSLEKIEDHAKKIFQISLEEDHFLNDITSIASIPKEARGKAHILLKEEGCIAGLNFLPHLLPDMECTLYAKDGDVSTKGSILARIEGNIRNILGYERPLLNLLQHLSGIATYTFQCKKTLKDLKCDLLDTRKTIPGLRVLEKYAVKMGGGKNHRKDLSDQILIKNNHLTFFEKNNRPVYNAVMQAKKRFPEKKIEVEVQNNSMLEEALAAKADIILLDNMNPKQIKECVSLARGKAYLEASGGINHTNIENYAKTGVNGISIGALTHSAKALDICLRLQKNDQ